MPKREEAIDVTQSKLAEEQIIEQNKRIEFFITEYSVEILAQKTRDNEYVIPTYQREFTWEDERKSRFIESLLMGLPIPFLFFWEMPDGRLEIVDGSQRLRTIEQFIYGGLKLGELDQLSRCSGMRFHDFIPSRQRKIKNRSIRGIVLNEHADEAARLDMFDRINTGSKMANTAEIRRGALAGPFEDLVISLGERADFQKLAPLSAKAKKERGYDELVARFFAYSDGLGQYRDRPADFVFDYTKSMNSKLDALGDKASDLEEAYRQRFTRMLDFVASAFPYGFRRSASGNFTPRTRFEAIALGSHEALGVRPDLASKDPKKLDVDLWIETSEFRNVVGSDGANAKARLRGRIEYVRDKLVGHDVS